MKPEIKPMSTEELAEFAAGSKALEGGGVGRPEGPSQPPRVEIAVGDSMLVDRIAGLERLATLTYAAVTMLLERFNVSDSEYQNAVKEIAAALRGHAQPPERSGAKGDPEGQ